ncbi:alkaline phosphatase D family protein [candidate division KSB1 bacterium]|nr:alkaline phosphatase D family protein [candidate division KSB1 bacterium]
MKPSHSQPRLGASFVLTAFLLLKTIPLETHAQALTHGPFVGAVTQQSARFYLRVEPAARASIRLATTPDFNNAMTAEPATTDSARDFTALIAVENLAADQRYYYQALVNDVPIGEVRSFSTFPRVGARAPFRFAFGSCIVNRRQPGTEDGRVFEVMAQDAPRFFLQIGDWTYPDSTDSPRNPQRVFSAEMARIQATYRSKYDSIYATQKILRIAPVDYVFDDHDYMNNDAAATSYPRPESLLTINVSPEIRTNGIRAYQELFPGYPLANANGGIWHKFTFGNAEFFMLDTRSQRSPNLEAFVRNTETDSIEFAPAPGHSMLAGDASLLGENQMDWLLRELQNSTADWKFMVSTVPFNRGLRGVIDLSVSLQDSFIVLPGQGAQSLLNVALGMSDKWVGFPEEQEKLLQFIHDRQIKNVIVLSGDTHTAAIDDGTNAGLPELMAGALEQSNSLLVFLLQLFGFNIWNGGGQINSFNDAYGRVTVFGADSVHLEIVDELGVLIAHQTLRSASSGNAVAAQNEAAAPFTFELAPSYPNPFHAQHQAGTTLSYKLQQRSFVTISIHDLMGREILHFSKGWQAAGEYELHWEGQDKHGEFVASGTYLVRLHLVDAQQREYRAAQKIALMR